MGRMTLAAGAAIVCAAVFCGPKVALAGDPAQATTAPAVKWSGYAEGYYGFNLGRPSNGITNFRAFDSRHNSFTLMNAVLAADWDGTAGYGRVALQVGTTGQSYYGSELTDFGASGAAGSSAEVYKHVQEAYAGAKFGANRELKLEFGLFLSPIGPENMAIKDQWTLSRSNLFFAFPFYHAGVRLHVPMGKSKLLVGVLNGYDGVLDKNDQKTLQIAYHRQLNATTELDMQYFVGTERERGAAEGSPLRHLFDTWISLHPHERFWAIVDVDVGMEDGDLGRSAWASGGLWLRLLVADGMYVATQTDFMREWRGRAGLSQASAIFWPVNWVFSQAVCLERRFADIASVKLEYRFDKAADKLYFKGALDRHALTNDWIANADAQQTVTLAVTSWF